MRKLVLTSIFFLVLYGVVPSNAQAPSSQCVASAVAGGTADAITIPPLPCPATTNLLIVTTQAANITTTPTLQVGAALPLVIVGPNGSPLVAGQIPGSGYRAILTPTGSTWILLNPFGAGTVTSLTAGTGIILTPSTITTSGIIAASGSPILTTPISNSISGNVSLSNTGTYFDGPTVAQGATGTWFAVGGITLQDTAGGAGFDCKLWDGTTVIDSKRQQTTAASQTTTLTLSNFLATPASNLKVSCKDETSTSGLIIFNASGNSKDSTISAFRLQ